MTDIIDTRTNPDEEGDLVDAWEQFLNGDLPFEELDPEDQARARKAFGV